MSKYLRFSLLTLSVLGLSGPGAMLSFPALAGSLPVLESPTQAWQMAQAKADPRKLPLQALLEYAESLQRQAGPMSANSVLILALSEPSSPLSESDRSVVKNQIALNYRKLAELETQTEVAKQAKPSLNAIEKALQTGDYALALTQLKTLKTQLEKRRAEKKSVGNLLSLVILKIAEISVMQGDFEAGFQWASQASGAAEHTNNQAFLARTFLTMGRLYMLGGDASQQIYAEMALNTAKMAMASEEIMGALQLKGEGYLRLGKAEQALAVQQDAFLKAKSQLSLAQIFLQLGDQTSALNQFSAARAGFQALPTAYYEAQALFGQAQIWHRQGRLADALAGYQTVLNLAKTVSQNKFLGEYSAGLGQALLAHGQTVEAIPVLEAALAGLKNANKADPDVQREASEKMIPTYHALIEAHLRLRETEPDDFFKRKHLQSAFNYLEASKAAIFLEDLKGWSNTMTVDDSLENSLSNWDVRNYLPPQTAALSFVQTADQHLIQFGFQRAGFHTQLSDLNALLAKQPIYQKYATSLRLNTGNLPDFSRLCQVYRQLLSNPQSDLNTVHELGHLLYLLLIQPQAAFIKDAKRLLVIPDGVLGLVPFETLRDAQGRYLVEQMDIQYIQSFDVLYHLLQREYSPERKPLLAMGAAEYQPVSYASEPIESPAEWLNLKRQLWSAPEAPMREIYGALYAPAWQPLPGSLTEIEAIQTLVPGTELLQGTEVSEAEIKARSEADNLSEYKILHWAVHGLTVPEIPELSALVLSQTSEPQSEDNYLRRPEIAKLKLKADFVNLSACETGLGKIFRGEGVVGLTQAFLQAGANRVSVSLWQISDTGTAQFMPAFYAKLGSGYSQALNATKREFLAGKYGKNHQHPYFWSPFVLYGLF
jgi:CHAT domain-containing protein